MSFRNLSVVDADAQTRAGAIARSSGGRSAQAAMYFAQQGFGDLYNVVGGIDAWSLDVDSGIPQY
jgi:monothiol glutaredoxin